MKKLLLSLGAVAAVAAPVAAVVACGSTTDNAEFKLKSSDLIQDFNKKDTALHDAAIKLTDDLLKATSIKAVKSETTLAKVTDEFKTEGALKVLNFSVDGKEGSFDFTKDTFYLNGNDHELKFAPEMAAKADTKYGVAAKASHSGLIATRTPGFGETHDYLPAVADATATDPLAIDPVKGLVINPAYKTTIETALTAVKAAESKDATTLKTADDAVNDIISKMETKIRYIIRNAIASKTSLHETLVLVENTETGEFWPNPVYSMKPSEFELAAPAKVAPKTTGTTTTIPATDLQSKSKTDTEIKAVVASTITDLASATSAFDVDLTGQGTGNTVSYDASTQILSITAIHSGQTVITQLHITAA